MSASCDTRGPVRMSQRERQSGLPSSMLSPRSALREDKPQGVRAPRARSRNMEELDELRQAIEAGDYDQALAILDELDAMSRDDKITKMMSYMRVLLTHLVKQVAEQRSTRSWEDSIT